jgi:hypothetical protein
MKGPEIAYRPQGPFLHFGIFSIFRSFGQGSFSMCLRSKDDGRAEDPRHQLLLVFGVDDRPQGPPVSSSPCA